MQQGVIKQDQADALVAQAEAEAKSARATGNDRGAAVAQAGDVRVPYIPQTVRDQIRDEVKAEVMTQAKEENWAQPNTFPDWVSRITVEGDVRVRDESRLYSGSNSNEITDFARMNAKGPYDVNPQGGNSYPPMLNTREDRRNQLRVRARLACAPSCPSPGPPASAWPRAATTARCRPRRRWAAACPRRTSGWTRPT